MRGMKNVFFRRFNRNLRLFNVFHSFPSGEISPPCMVMNSAVGGNDSPHGAPTIIIKFPVYKRIFVAVDDASFYT